MSRPADLLLVLIDMELERLEAGGDSVLELGDDEAVVLLSELPAASCKAFIEGLRTLRDLRSREPLVFELLIPRVRDLISDFHRVVVEQSRGAPMDE